MAPRFALPSLTGETVDLAAYRGHANVVGWFSRGFTRPFCRVYTDGVRSGYTELRAADTEVIQVAPNRAEIFRQIDPAVSVHLRLDKRLYAVYGLADRRALEATRTAVVSFAHAFTHGDTVNQIRGAWFDVMNRNFVRRLHHHAMTAHEQGIFVIDKEGVIRHVTVVGPIDPVPRGGERADPARRHCVGAPTPV